MMLTISLIVSALAAFYVYLVWHFNYWKKRDVPGPEPLPLLGNFKSFLLRQRSPLYEIDDIYSEYKAKYNFVGVFSNRSPRILVLSASLAKDILSKHFKNFHDNEFAEFADKDNDPLFGRNPFMLNGEEWKAKRAEITPAFTTSRMKALFPIIEEVGARMTKYLKDHANSPVETKEVAAKFTTDVVSSCIFDTDAQSFVNEKAEIREKGRQLMDSSFTSILMLMFLSVFPSLAKLLNVGLVPKSLEKFFTNLMAEAVRYRENNKITRVDYLEYLIGLRNKKEISELDMAAHGVTFFIDGFETSSVGMSFALYELANNADIQKRLRQEFKDAANADGTISYEVLLDLPYLEQVLNEALRLWSPAGFISKKCTIPMDLEMTSTREVRIETEVCAMIPIWSIHRDPENYENPNVFNPERFNPETGGTAPFREKGCYMPFGEGPRQCLGMRFARMQVKRGIYEIIRNFEVTVNSKTKQPLELDPKQFLTMANGGIWLDYKPITTSA